MKKEISKTSTEKPLQRGTSETGAWRNRIADPLECRNFKPASDKTLKTTSRPSSRMLNCYPAWIPDLQDGPVPSTMPSLGLDALA